MFAFWRKLCSALTGQGASIFDLKIYWAICLCKRSSTVLLTWPVWPTIHNSISKICRQFQVIGSHFFEVDELLDEHWAKIVQSENISTPIYVECDKMYLSKVCVEELSYFVSRSGVDIQLEQSENDSPVRKEIGHPGCRWRNTTVHLGRVTYRFFGVIETILWLSG